MIDKTCLSHWFPKIAAAGIPVPRTIIVTAPEGSLREVWRAFDGEKPGAAANEFYQLILNAANEIGYPCFLRTGHTSGKHDWKNCCYLESADRVQRQVLSIIEYGEIASFAGMPHDVWAIREFLPTIPLGHCPGFGDMPICREFRFFVRNGNVECWHPYWPQEALDQGSAIFRDGNNYDTLSSCAEFDPLTVIAEKAGRAVGGHWSIDILETERGWYVTDMAEAEKSFHWKDCPISAKNMRGTQ